MASLKAERPTGSSSLYGQAGKASEGPSRGPASKQTTKKAEEKPRQPKKKQQGKGGKPAAKK